MRKLALMMAFIMAFTSVAPAYAETPAANEETAVYADYEDVSSDDIIEEDANTEEEDVAEISDETEAEASEEMEAEVSEEISEEDVNYGESDVPLSAEYVEKSYDYGNGYLLAARIETNHFTKAEIKSMTASIQFTSDVEKDICSADYIDDDSDNFIVETEGDKLRITYFFTKKFSDSDSYIPKGVTETQYSLYIDTIDSCPCDYDYYTTVNVDYIDLTDSEQSVNNSILVAVNEKFSFNRVVATGKPGCSLKSATLRNRRSDSTLAVDITPDSTSFSGTAETYSGYPAWVDMKDCYELKISNEKNPISLAEEGDYDLEIVIADDQNNEQIIVYPYYLRATSRPIIDEAYVEKNDPLSDYLVMTLYIRNTVPEDFRPSFYHFYEGTTLASSEHGLVQDSKNPEHYYAYMIKNKSVDWTTDIKGYLLLPSNFMGDGLVDGYMKTVTVSYCYDPIYELLSCKKADGDYLRIFWNPDFCVEGSTIDFYSESGNKEATTVVNSSGNRPYTDLSATDVNKLKGSNLLFKAKNATDTGKSTQCGIARNVVAVTEVCDQTFEVPNECTNWRIYDPKDPYTTILDKNNSAKEITRKIIEIANSPMYYVLTSDDSEDRYYLFEVDSSIALVDWEFNGGTAKDDDYSVYYTSGQVDEIVFPEPTKDGYTFLGWYLDAEFTKPAKDIDPDITGNIKFYAKWQEIEGETAEWEVISDSYNYKFGFILGARASVKEFNKDNKPESIKMAVTLNGHRVEKEIEGNYDYGYLAVPAVFGEYGISDFEDTFGIDPQDGTHDINYELYITDKDGETHYYKKNDKVTLHKKDWKFTYSAKTNPTKIATVGGYNVQINKNLSVTNLTDKATKLKLVSYRIPDDPDVLFSKDIDVSPSNYKSTFSEYPYWVGIKDCYTIYINETISLPFDISLGDISLEIEVDGMVYEYPQYFVITNENYIYDICATKNDSASEYFSYLIYGLNLKEVGALDFYSDKCQKIAGPSYGDCTMEVYPDGNTYYEGAVTYLVTVPKANSSDPIWNSTFTGIVYAPEGISDTDTFEVKYDASKCYSAVTCTDKNGNRTVRIYLQSNFAKVGDSIEANIDYPQRKLTKTVKGSEWIYVEFTPDEYNLFWNRTLKNKRTGKTASVDWDDGNECRLLEELVIPARANYFIIDPKGLFEPIVQGATAGESSVLDKKNIAELAKTSGYYYLYTLNGNGYHVSNVAFVSGDSYPITWVLNDGYITKDSDSLQNLPDFYFSEDGFRFEDINEVHAEKYGYQFDGWYTDAKFKNKATNIAVGETGARTFYAKWVINKATITFDANAGSVSEKVGVTGKMNPVKLTYSNKATTLPANKFAVKGYTFECWEWLEGGRSYNDKASYYVYYPGDITLTAKWQKDTYSINYHFNGAVPDSTKPANTLQYSIDDWGTDNVKVYDAVIPAGKENQLEFKGWYRDPNFKTKFEGLKKEETGNIDLYACVVNKSYTIVFDNSLSGKDHKTVEQTFQWNVPTALKANSFKYVSTTEKKAFNAWSYQVETGTSFLYDKDVITGLADAVPEEDGKIHLYACWKNDFVIFLANNKEDFEKLYYSNACGYEYGKGLTTAELNSYAPTKYGYKFDGWVNAKGAKVSSISKTAYGDMYLYAKWSPIKVKINFNNLVYAGGLTATGKIKTINTDTSKTVAAPKNTVKIPGASFFCYRCIDGDGSKVYFENAEINVLDLYYHYGFKDNITLNAIFWEDAPYTITYNNLLDGMNNPKNKASYSVYDTLNATVPLYEPGVPEGYSGYKFEGWYTDAKLSKKMTAIPKKQTGNLNLYAKWTKNITVEYYVDATEYAGTSYSPYTVTGSMKTQTVNLGKGATLSANAFKVVEYSSYYKKDVQVMGFVGWQLEDGRILADKATISLDNVRPVGDKIRLKAIFSEKSTVRYIDSDGSILKTAEFYYSWGEYGLYTPKPKKGYNFDGWYTDAKYKKKLTSIPGKTESLNLYAKWTPVKYTINFRVNAPLGAKITGSTKAMAITLGSGKKLNANGYKAAGYRFLGWSTKYSSSSVDIEDKGNITDNLLLNESNNYSVNLYAVWEPITYKLTYNLGASNITNSAKFTDINYRVTDEIILVEPVRSGYTFLGWYNGGKKVTSLPAGTTGNITLTAKWQLNKAPATKK